MTRVLILDPSPVVEAGLREVLKDFSAYKVLDAHLSGELSARLDRIAALDPDIVLIDPALFPLLRRQPIRATWPVLQEVVLVAVARGGADEELLAEFDGVIDLYDSPARIHHKLKHALETASTTPPVEGYELSEREREVLVAVARGSTNKQIAEQYCLSVHTVISHRKNITRKTGIKTIAGLTAYALLNKMVSEAEL